MFPALFVSHGAPTFAIDPGIAGPALTAYGQSIQLPDAVIVLSPHWQTNGLVISSGAAPETIHDFYGFPTALYSLQYPVNGAPEVAHQLIQHLADKAIPARLERARGLDHGAWVPLRYLFPHAKVPVMQISLPVNWGSHELYQLGVALSDFLPQKVLFVGSGSLTHNLYEFRGNAGDKAAPYAEEFSEWIATHLLNPAPDKVVRALELAPHAKRAHPTDEHFTPLSFVLGIAGGYQKATRLVNEIRHGVLSMDAYSFDRTAVGA